MKILKTLISSFFVGCISVGGMSQEVVTETLMKNIPPWREGSIVLNDGREFTGQIRYEDMIGILSFQNGEISKTLRAEGCARFGFYEEENRIHRIFYSLEYEDKGTPRKFYFFEALKSFKDFALLSKVDPIEVQNRTRSTGSFISPDGKYYSPGTLYTIAEVHQTETLYFMNSEGKIEPYLHILEKEAIGLLGDHKRSKNKFIDKKLLERYTGEYYNQLEIFAIKNRLSFKIKRDLLKILDLYAELIDE